MFAEWTLLDCVFGVPLFDGRLNAGVLGSLGDAELLGAASLPRLQRLNRRLSLRLLAFLAQFRPVAANNADPDHTALPYPTHSLLFDGANVVPQPNI